MMTPVIVFLGMLDAVAVTLLLTGIGYTLIEIRNILKQQKGEIEP
jgi:hypothetical protein